jgi:hypothetical protein
MPSRVEFGQDTEAFFQRFTLIEQIGIGGMIASWLSKSLSSQR